jgi:preprotein translocase subunit SecF
MKQIITRRYWWFALSALLILPGLYVLLLHPLVTTGQFRLGLRPSIDFTGGAIWELYFPGQQLDQLDPEEIAQIYGANGFEGAQVQLSRADTTAGEVSAAIVRTKALSGENPEADQQRVLDALTTRYGAVERARLDNVGATLSQESTRNAIIAVLGASLAILIYLTWAFRQAPNPLRYGVCSIVAMFHDVILMIGVAALLGLFFNVEVDVLFVTALLTILAFSVHDKIVIFDRIRENLLKRRPGESFDELVNLSIVQTLPRSINTQLTPLFTLTALLLFGGVSIRNFVIVQLLGLISGTYSSIFIAPQLLVMWEHGEWRKWFGRGRNSGEETEASVPA